jgi:hypothetical protein
VIKAGDDSKTQQEIDKEFVGFKDELRNRGSLAKEGSPEQVKIYQPRNDSGKKQGSDGELQPTLIGFNELENSELLQGSSLLKSLNNSRTNYNTSEDVNALMDSSFLVNTIEAMKEMKEKKKQRVKLTGDTPKNQGRGFSKRKLIKKETEEDRRSTLGNLKKQIVGNLYQYYDSKNSKEDQENENYFKMSSDLNKDADHEIYDRKSLGYFGMSKEMDQLNFSKHNEESNNITSNVKKDVFLEIGPDDKVSDIEFLGSDQENFIELGGDPSDKDIMSKQVMQGTMDMQEQEIDFNLTKNLENKDNSHIQISPLDEYGEMGGKHKIKTSKKTGEKSNKEDVESDRNINKKIPSELDYTVSEMQSPEASNIKGLNSDKQDNEDQAPSSVHRPSNYSSNDLVSPPMSDIEGHLSEQDIEKIFSKNPKFHKDNRDLDLGSELYSDAPSPNRSNPSITTNFIKQRMPQRTQSPMNESLPLSQLNFQSIENKKLTNPHIQNKLEDLVKSIKKAQTLKSRKPSLIQRQQLFDRLLIEEIEAGYLKSNFVVSEKTMPRIVNFGKDKSEQVIPDVPRSKGSKVKKEHALNLMFQKFQDKNFPGILCSLVDNVRDPDFGTLARMEFRRMGDMLSPFIRETRIRPFKSRLFITFNVIK